jgi:hypothetical protein
MTQKPAKPANKSTSSPKPKTRRRKPFARISSTSKRVNAIKSETGCVQSAS